MLIDDGYRNYFLYRVAGGRVSEVELDERPEDAAGEAIALPLDELATVTLARDVDGITALVAAQLEAQGDELEDDGPDGRQLPLRYTDEDALRTIATRVAAAIDDGVHAFVAEIELVRYLVELAPGRARVRRLVFAGAHALAERLLRGGYTTPPAPRRDRGGKCELALYWPEDMLRAIQDEATRTDRSMSWIVQYAWKQVGADVAAADRATLAAAVAGYAGDKRKQTLYYPGEMIDAFEAQARRLDSSQSFVVQSAVALARHHLAAIPSFGDSPGDPE